MKRSKLVIVLVTFLLIGLAACGQSPTPVPTQPPSATEAAVIPTDTVSPPTDTPVPTPTEEPTATAEPPTPTPDPPTATAEPPTSTPEPTVTAEPTATPTVVVESAPLAPGQVATKSLAGEAFDLYTFTGTQFRPLLIFVEVGSDFDVSAAVYEGEITTAGALEESTPLSEADAGTEGAPEILVFTPEENGQYSLVIRGTAGGEAGIYFVHLFDALTAIDESTPLEDALAAGETKSYTVESNGRRPILVFVDPTDRSDLSIAVSDPDGNVVAEADFSGSLSAEALYVLPRQTTTYTVTISEVNDAAATYNLLIVALQELETEG